MHRMHGEIKRVGIIFAILLLYYVFVRLTGIRIPCVFYEITGLLCPGCGITRMVMSASQFDFFTAYSYNKFMFVTAPFLVVCACVYEIHYIRTGNRRIKCAEPILWLYTAALIAFAVVRNIV